MSPRTTQANLENIRSKLKEEGDRSTNFLSFRIWKKWNFQEIE